MARRSRRPPRGGQGSRGRRGGSSFHRRPVLPPPPSLSRPTEEQRGASIRGRRRVDPSARVDPAAAHRFGGGRAELWRRRVDVGAGGGERGPLLTSAPSAARWPRAPAQAARVRKAGSDATRERAPAVAPSDSAVNGHQPRGPEGASSAGPQAQELRPDVPRVPDASWCFLVDP